MQTQVLIARTADFVTANALGGFDYVIGTEGLPLLLMFADAGANESPPGQFDAPLSS